MDNLSKILQNCLYSTDNNIRQASEKHLSSLDLSAINLQSFFNYLLDNNNDISLRKMLSIYIKNYLASYFVSISDL